MRGNSALEYGEFSSGGSFEKIPEKASTCTSSVASEIEGEGGREWETEGVVIETCVAEKSGVALDRGALHASGEDNGDNKTFQKIFESSVKIFPADRSVISGTDTADMRQRRGHMFSARDEKEILLSRVKKCHDRVEKV